MLATIDIKDLLFFMPALTWGYLLCGGARSGTNPSENWDRKMIVKTDDPKEEEEEILFEELSVVWGTGTWWCVVFPGR